ncbi:MAG: hypothetical protein JWO20_3283 [Candidatus Angelobacter sp.]|nr:hypothetical protein [Candidatus Angelobacter sp.]
MPVEYKVPQCQHVRTNGVRCGSPALKTKPMCFYHNRMALPLQVSTIPYFEDGDAIQHAIWKVVQGLLGRHIEPKDAGRILYALQIASANLKQTRNQPNWRHVERVDPVADQVEAGYASYMKSIQDRMPPISQPQSADSKESKENKVAV